MKSQSQLEHAARTLQNLAHDQTLTPDQRESALAALTFANWALDVQNASTERLGKFLDYCYRKDHGGKQD